ncbi:glycosyltransferase family 2 protein [Blastomonas aquatica]|uniref:Bactoprenol glucosyl transferase n=1 Tax=Blastomonas aquatica TaxID=1510276 RepID=A0ABQ1J9P0_9SPHN|nr:glycosyltransferase family 2 protein [Blastomonas aquatica]GGB62024.1 bactoprenol glucosyl transferase [Blastomonas aquatica]
MTVDLSIVVPVLNEQESVACFVDAVTPIVESLGLRYEIIFIDDGSTDATADIVCGLQRNDPHIRLIRLSRNFGKEAALTAGLDFSTGAAVVPMDVDLQDPPSLLCEMVARWREGYDIAFGQRVERRSDTGTKRVTAGLFYRVFNSISGHPIDANAGDFRLMSRAAVDATLVLRERNRFMKGLFAWVGFRSIAVPYERPARVAGTTKFNYWKLWNFALDGITSFSTAPLKIWTYVGGSVALIALIYTAVIVAQTLIFGRDVPGYASLMVVILVLGAVQLMSLGIIGEYLGRMYMETKQRPIYLVKDTAGFPPSQDRADGQFVPRDAVRAAE